MKSRRMRWTGHVAQPRRRRRRRWRERMYIGYWLEYHEDKTAGNNITQVGG
jgi:hypothetical protein